MVVTATCVTFVPSRWHECDIGMCHKCAKLTVTSVRGKNLDSVDIHLLLCLTRVDKTAFYDYME